MYDRMVVGGAMPVGEVFETESTDPLKAPFFLTRSGLVIFNVGGADNKASNCCIQIGLYRKPVEGLRAIVK